MVYGGKLIKIGSIGQEGFMEKVLISNLGQKYLLCGISQWLMGKDRV